MKSLFAKIAFAALLCVALFFILNAGREYLSRQATIKAENELRPAIDEAKKAAESASALAEDINLAIKEKDAALLNLAERLRATETGLRQARQNSANLRASYEKILNNRVVTGHVDVAGLCSDLAGLGYECK